MSDAVSDEIDLVDITPSPKILKVLANIEFEPWQCMAELIDNSFDEFLDIERSDPRDAEPRQVSVFLPSVGAGADATITVRDNGRGMTLDDVRNAVRAGYSGNDPVSKLGLFGMGFNVSTARLGSVTRFLTTRDGDSHWVGVEIDLNNLNEGFKVPVITREKESLSEHGTWIEIGSLDEFSGRLRHHASKKKLREVLGSTYSYLLDNKGYQLYIDSIPVKPVRHCVWDETRQVTRGGEVIPAIIKLDQVLPEMAVCRTCGYWQDPDVTACEQCGMDSLERRERRIWGWVGIQRFLDDSQYGIDFLRNGRKIRRNDKDVFVWRDPEDPGDQGESEYPIEIPRKGRIVGEIHLDHVPVHYTKGAFDTNHTSWRYALRMLRGDGPLRPQLAARLGYSANETPIARLFNGYRRNDPGKNYLTPGDGATLVNRMEWVEKFREGDVDFQSDEKWWDAVVAHDDIVEKKKRDKEERESKGEDPTTEFFGDDEDDDSAVEAPADTTEPQTENERKEALLANAVAMTEIDDEFTIRGVAGRPTKIRGYRVSHRIDLDGHRVPVWLTGDRGGSFVVFVDESHPHFKKFDDDPAELALLEITQHMIARSAGTDTTITTGYTELKDRHLGGHSIDPSVLAPDATRFMREIQERMVACVAENPERPWQKVLTESERDTTRDRITRALKTADTDSAVYSGEYLTLVPNVVIPRIIEEWPEAFFDGKIFDAPYAQLASSTARRQIVAKVAGYLNDAAWLTEVPAGSRDELLRARLSLRLLPAEIAGE